jgi:hypothetical protein
MIYHHDGLGNFTPMRLVTQVHIIQVNLGSFE